jgi:TPR repeat protein
LVGVAYAENSIIEETRKKAQRGDTQARFLLVMLYAKGLGVPEDYAEVFKWF